jgi:23S rRNA (uridine2552-2'-O)-methyltransferase
VTITFDPATYKRTTRAQWQDAAEAWDRWGPLLARWLGPSTEAMRDLAAVGPGSRVLDVAAGAGEQTLSAARRVGAKGRVLATDILPMNAVANVDFIQGDFTEDAVVEQLLGWLGEGKFDLIVSDIAPNITGIDSADQAGSMYFLELALDTVRKTLKPGATFVAKMFQGSGSDQYVKELRTSFGKVLIRKPAASRAESREVYIVAKDFRERRSS